MISVNEISYWIAVSNLHRWGYEKINRLVIEVLHKNKIEWKEFFSKSEFEWKNNFNLSDKEISSLKDAKKELPNYSFLAEDLLSQGFEIIPVTSSEYSGTLKENLKAKFSPPVLYIKGNKQILQEDSVAVVGSRNASGISLQFTDNIASLASEKFKVVVSGFAKGVDKYALECSLKYKGQSIIVLPQGIMTFSSGIKKYYEQIVEGNVLVLSVFHPKVSWSVGLAMARNPIIYGLAKDIYVAQSNDHGGTWEGVLAGLKAGRKIYVRAADESENNANKELIEKGCTPVDMSGNEIVKEELTTKEPAESYSFETAEQTPKEKILQLFKNENDFLSAKEIKEKLNLDLSTLKLSALLRKSGKYEQKKGSPIKFRLKTVESTQGSLFDEDKIPEMKLK